MGKVPRTVPNGTTSELEADLSALLVLSESEFGYGLRNAYTRPGWVEPKSARKWSKRVGDTVSPAFSPHIQSTSSLLCTDFRDSCTGMRRHVPGHAEESLNVHGMGAPGRCGRSGVRSGGSGAGRDRRGASFSARDFISRPGAAGWSRLDGQEARAATCSRPRNPSASFPIC